MLGKHMANKTTTRVSTSDAFACCTAACECRAVAPSPDRCAFLRAMHSHAARQHAHVALSRYMSEKADTRLEASFRLVSAFSDMHRS